MGGDILKLPEGMESFSIESAGVIRIDVIPYKVGPGNPYAAPDTQYWERTFFIHRGVGVNEQWVVCPAKTLKKPCPICEEVSRMDKDPNADDEMAKALAPSRRMVLHVRDLKKDPDKVKIWHISHAYFGKAIDEALQAEYEDKENNKDNFCAESPGYYLKCQAETGWQGHGFSVERVDFVPRKEGLDQDILSQAVCLDKLLVIHTYDELKRMLHGTGPAEGSKKTKTGKDQTPAEETADTDLAGMDRTELKQYIKENNLDVKVFKNMSDDDIRDAITAVSEPEEPEGEEPEPEGAADEFDALDRTELKEYIKENKLEVKVFKNMSDDDIREAIRTAEGAGEEPEPEGEEPAGEPGEGDWAKEWPEEAEGEPEAEPEKPATRRRKK